MFYQRPISLKLVNSSKSGYQKIDIVGNRYFIIINDGKIDNCQMYGSMQPITNQKDIDRMQRIVDENDFLFKFTGILEVLMNNFQFYIIDIVEDGESTQDKVYEKRLEYITSNVNNPNIVVTENKVGFIETSVLVPTLYRSLDCAYKYGNDYIVNPTVKDSVFVIVGESIDMKETKILIPKTDYDNINKVPKVIRVTFDNLDQINEWKNQMFEREDTVKITKQDVEYVEFENVEKTKIYIVIGKCSISNNYKVFGKLKPTNKLSIIDKTPSENVHFDYVNEKFNSNENVFYKTGYVVSCTTPKVSSKNLANITVLDVKQHINLEKPITTNIIDNIPTVQIQQLKKKIINIPTKIIAEELIERLLKVPMYHNVAVALQNMCENENINIKEESEESDDEDVVEIPAKKMKVN